ncbi:hypothetical protein F4703DRAFT_1981162 [Phycomyces blakesleeanus]
MKFAKNILEFNSPPWTLCIHPRNSFDQRVLERTVATYFIIFIVKQLLISNNGILELDWLECKFFAMNRTKRDGVLIKFDNRSYSANYDLSSSTPCSIIVLFVTADTCIYFEKLTSYNNMLFRSIRESIGAPTSPRKCVEAFKEIPKIQAWRQAVVDHTVGLK